MQRRAASWAILAACATAAAPGAAAAQVLSGQGLINLLDQNLVEQHSVAVREREHEDYTPLGLHFGPFRGNAQLQADLGFTSNEKGAETGEQADAVVRLGGSANLQSDWSRHALGSFLSYRRTEFARFSEDSANEYAFGANGRLDVTGTTKVALDVREEHILEPRTDPNTPINAVESTEYDRATVDLAGIAQLSRITLGGELQFVRQDYGVVRGVGDTAIDLRFRNGQTIQVTGSAAYPVSPSLGVYVSSSFRSRSYDLSQLGEDRGSDGQDLLVGTIFDLSSLFRGDVAIGYVHQSSDFMGGSDTSGLRVRASVAYFPTQLTTISGTVIRDNLPSDFAGSAGRNTTAFTIQADHELLRNVILTGRAGYEQDDYTGNDRQDSIFTMGLQADYLLNRRVALQLTYAYQNADSSGRDRARSIEEQHAMLAVVLKY